jgi:tRNA dimethylallyltransferase
MKKVIVLLGPTGVGKTAVSILLAKTLNSEIISADSMQIYRHMDIGTAKPSVEDMRSVRHHMIDVAEPWESFSTGAYISNVGPLIDSLIDKGRMPIIAGGTGLYIKAMTRGIFKGPSADWQLRDELLKREKDKPGSLYNHLKSVDPVAASRIMPADTRRIVRALEVCLKEKTAISALHETSTRPLPYEFIKIGLMRERKELYSMIEKRVDTMIRQGLLDEVKTVIRLISRRASPLSCSSMQAIGYKEIAMHLDAEITLDEAINLIKQRSRNYAKRQLTWFKKEENIQWTDITGNYDAKEICRKVIELIKKPWNRI